MMMNSPSSELKGREKLKIRVTKREPRITERGRLSIFKNLEKKNNELTDENIALKQENKKLKQELLDCKWRGTPKNDFKSLIKSHEDYIFFGLSNLAKDDPSKIRFSQIDWSDEYITEWSPTRIGLIK